MQVINLQQAQNRYSKLEVDVLNTFTSHNSLLDSYFDQISALSSILPSYLTQVTILADMITDALVVSGNGLLSTLASSMPIRTKSSVIYTQATNSLQLGTVAENSYTINSKTSYILSDTNYTVFNVDQTAISSFGQLLLNKDEICITTKQENSKYTLALDLGAANLKINSVLLTLGLTTESYPFISEMYYINQDNKKVNCFILNTLTNSFDMDINRVLNNAYNLAITPIETNRLYIVLEDTGKTKLNIASINIQQVQHEASGSITFGPLTSVSPILKASIEASGTLEGAKFSLSTDGSNWLEILTPNEVNLNADIRKVMSFNTVNTRSLQLEKDVNQLYLKVDLEAIPIVGDTSTIRVMKQSFTGTSLTLSSAYTVGNISVYSDTYNVNYGFDKKASNLNAYDIFDRNISKVLYNNAYILKGFIDSIHSYSSSSTASLLECVIKSSALKIGGLNIQIPTVEPKSTTLYGYSLTKNTAKEFNKDVTDNIVLKLKDTYYKGVYSIRQGDKEILIDLSLGYINSCIDGIFVVKPELPVSLYTSLGDFVSILSTAILPDGVTNYVSLVENEMFEVPASPGLVFNTLYPLTLNGVGEFGLLDSSIVSTIKLITLTNVYTLNKESIKTSIKLSKENVNQLLVTDTSTLESYLNAMTETLPAFTANRAMKLKNRDIKKGSLSVLRDDSPYLVEVVYQNGVDEFKTYRSQVITQPVNITAAFASTYQVSISNEVEDYSTVQASIVGRYEVPVYFRQVDGAEGGTLEFYTDSANYFLPTDILEITFLSLSENPSNLYSMNYEEGILYMSAVINSDLLIKYGYYSTFMTGLKAQQLDTRDYTYASNSIEIVNDQTNTNYIVDFEVITALSLPTTTPFITDLKINYINTLDVESLP